MQEPLLSLSFPQQGLEGREGPEGDQGQGQASCSQISQHRHQTARAPRYPKGSRWVLCSCRPPAPFPGWEAPCSVPFPRAKPGGVWGDPSKTLGTAGKGLCPAVLLRLKSTLRGLHVTKSLWLLAAGKEDVAQLQNLPAYLGYTWRQILNLH